MTAPRSTGTRLLEEGPPDHGPLQVSIRSAAIDGCAATAEQREGDRALQIVPSEQDRRQGITVNSSAQRSRLPLDQERASLDLGLERNPVDQVVAVVSTHRPSDQLVENVNALLTQTNQVVIIDDGSGPSADRLLEQVAGDRVTVVRLPANRGIAAALNAGIEIARQVNARYLLTMDQDSRLSPEYVATAVSATTQLELAGKGVLAVGAGTVNGICIDPRDPRSFVPILDTLQSGLLFRMEAMDAIGPFDERLFIDCVDTEYILRGATLGFETFRAKACSLDHALGRSLSGRLPGGRSVEFAYHTAWRRYYITRNRIEVVRRYGLRFPKWTALQGYDQARYFGLTLLFGPQPGRQLMAFGAAVAHGLGRRLGPIPARLHARLSGPATVQEHVA